MNERIKELALQAGGSHYPDVNTAQLEKFAELIVQDCADLAYSYNIFGRGRAWNLIIKEHFGLPVVDADLPPYLRKQGVE
jgi:hypothetical protein